MDGADSADQLLRRRDRAVGGHRDELAGALQAPPGVGPVAGVAGDARHRRGVQRLQQQGPDAAGIHGGIPVDGPDHIVGRVPAFAVGAPDPGLARLGVGAGDLGADDGADQFTQPCQGVHGAKRRRDAQTVFSDPSEEPRGGSRTSAVSPCGWAAIPTRTRSPLRRGARGPRGIRIRTRSTSAPELL